ncbi:MAG: CPBP family intramembrane glutamic endopeptidase [Anaerolineales bacterium]
MNTTKPFNWKIFFILLAASVFGVIAILPYSLALEADVLAKATLPMPLPLLLSIQVLENTVLFAVAILIGLFLANRIGLGLPILEAKLAGESVAARIKAILLPSISLGVAGSILIIALDKFVFAPGLQAQLGSAANALNLQTAQPAAWKGLLASFYGGINEELLLRLCVFTLLAWLGKFVSHTPEGRPTLVVLWIANILAAILFGLGHLPATATLIALTPLVIVRAIVLNGLAGIVFGYLYWTRGLESAMLSHFSADLVLHVLLAL